MCDQETEAQACRFSLTALVRAELQKPDEDDPTITKGQRIAELWGKPLPRGLRRTQVQGADDGRRPRE